MGHSPEELDQFSRDQQEQEVTNVIPRPLSHRIISWILIAIVLFGFLGTCYWLAFYGKV